MSVILNYFKIHIHTLSENVEHSFVLLTCDEKQMDSTIEKIRTIPGVTDVNRIQGIYDILVQIRAPNEIIKETVRTKIRYTNGVRSALTLFVYDVPSQ